MDYYIIEFRKRTSMLWTRHEGAFNSPRDAQHRIEELQNENPSYVYRYLRNTKVHQW